MRTIILICVVLCACGNPAGPADSGIESGDWYGKDARNNTVCLSYSHSTITYLQWNAWLSDYHAQEFEASGITCYGGQFVYEMPDMFGNTAHIEAEYNAETDEWTGYHREYKDGEGWISLSFTLTRT